jgi:hypothetical protein
MSISKQIHADLLDMVSKHDYSYMMSDSHSVWESGMVYEKHIKAKIHALCAIHREDAEALYNEVKPVAGPDYLDYDKNGRGLKYRVIWQWFEVYIGLDTISS